MSTLIFEEALFRKSTHKGGGSQKYPKISHVVYGWPVVDTLRGFGETRQIY